MAQWKAEAAFRKRGLSKDYSSTLVTQAQGPLRQILIPIGHARRSRFPLFHKALKCRITAKEVDSQRLLAVFDASEAAEDLEAEVPLDMLADVCS